MKEAELLLEPSQGAVQVPQQAVVVPKQQLVNGVSLKQLVLPCLLQYVVKEALYKVLDNRRGGYVVQIRVHGINQIHQGLVGEE